VERLASVPRPPGCKKLVGGDKEWRIRIGDYRVVYEIDDAAKTVDVTRIAHRRDVYE
jgi:mRNA interferase RelE/StbE